MKRRFRSLALPVGKQPKPHRKSSKVQSLAAVDYEKQVERLQQFWSTKPVVEAGSPLDTPVATATPTQPRPTLQRRMY